MFLIETVKGLKNKLNELQKTGTTGFVPTMGALHDGHISLVRQAVSENKTVVASIFVNPTQFNDPKDLERYPRNLNADLKLLEKTGCHIVFAPSPEEIYPEPDTRKFDFGALETVMEGKHRPGHFNGVAQVVSKLFDIVHPDKAYFGLKDFQQLAIIKEMVSQLKLPVEIVPCGIVREESGLAMSSRNELLSAEERKNAAVISKTLFEAKKLSEHKSVRELAEWIKETINKNPYLTVEYVEIVESSQLQRVNSWEDKGEKVCCVAVFCGKIRLIDNVVLTKKTK
ncbi:MAG: pantoate--beta-alanine ligase [Bacteroidetes bacterium]|nr:MAG: pantoate--beta-alanine ligase [Bacteroidota bacterium]